MNDEHCVILIKDVDDLEDSSAGVSTPYQPFAVSVILRVGRFSFEDHIFCILGPDTVSGDVFNIPIVPAKFH